MNEPSITSVVKEKDPRRVVARKRLGAISKQAKEAKRLEREVQALEQQTNQSENNNYTLCFVGGLVAVGAASYLYLNKDNKKKLPTIPEEEEEKPTPAKNSKCIFAN